MASLAPVASPSASPYSSALTVRPRQSATSTIVEPRHAIVRGSEGREETELQLSNLAPDLSPQQTSHDGVAKQRGNHTTTTQCHLPGPVYSPRKTL